MSATDDRPSATGRTLKPPRRESPHNRVADEEIVIYYIRRRDGLPKRDCLTPRMEARQIIDALDLARRARP